MDRQIKGRVALVTGASQGIGEAIARALHREGVKVALLARNAERLGRIVADLGEGAHAVSGDVMSADSLAAAIETAQATFGPIDIAVNNAGGVISSTGGLFRPFEEAPDADWRATFEFNVLSAVRVARALAPRMAERGWGRIINISSERGVQPDPIGIEYGAAKGALNILSKGLARAYADKGVLVNVVSPAFVDTQTLRNVLAQQEGAEEVSQDDLAMHFLAGFRPNIGVGRPCRPEDVAAAVVFLASEGAAFVTGVNLRVDGGSVTTL
jgi:NAD(P)-dependent dehydrogenase (short-subunit alcohol dehydrogenase family)